MLKNNFFKGIKLSACFLFFVFGFIFNSCENFMNGSGLQSDLTTAIEYANAPSYKILVAAEPDSGTIVAGAGISEKKVTDSIHLKFQLKKGYRFIKWQAVTKTLPELSMSDYVSFADAFALETDVTIEKASDNIQIVPLCEESFKLNVAESSPEKKERRCFQRQFYKA